ncbi:mechanosensitive ion channel family protein [Methyloligella sp. 2.7D]|uniref:mechanosensitive ion channel family protein n=1 Tax=unclassified Methyloligella TaxID=2625955 RepID=UPI001ABBC5D0|nr:mechanosensitive ion channel family protein [Methyloligella sp. GL2]
MPFLRNIWALLFVFILAAGLSGAAFAQDAAAPAPAENTAAANDTAAELPPAVTDPSITGEVLTIRLVPLTKEELVEVAAKWQKLVEAKTTEVSDAQVALLSLQGKQKDEARKHLLERVNERNQYLKKFGIVVNALERKGGNAETIADYRTYGTAIATEEARSNDYRTLFAQFQGWLASDEGGLRVLRFVIVIAVAFTALLIIARLVRRSVARWIGHVKNLSKLLQAFIVTVVYWITLALGLMIVVSMLGVDITPLFALIGGASFIMAFAFQDTLSNLAAGLMIMVYRPFDEGDYVDVGGVAGTVKAVSIVATTVTTPDNQIIVIPNKQVWGEVITNVTVSPTRRVDLTAGIGYDDDIEKATEVLEETVAAHPLVLQDPAPVVRVSELGDNSVNFIVRPWVRGADYWAVRWDLTRQIKEAFDKNGISIPFPQRDIHVYNASAPELAAPAPSHKTHGGSKPNPTPKNPAEAEAQGAEGYEEDQQS